MRDYLLIAFRILDGGHCREIHRRRHQWLRWVFRENKSVSRHTHTPTFVLFDERRRLITAHVMHLFTYWLRMLVDSLSKWICPFVRWSRAVDNVHNRKDFLLEASLSIETAGRLLIRFSTIGKERWCAWVCVRSTRRVCVCFYARDRRGRSKVYRHRSSRLNMTNDHAGRNVWLRITYCQSTTS